MSHGCSAIAGRTAKLLFVLALLVTLALLLQGNLNCGRAQRALHQARRVHSEYG